MGYDDNQEREREESHAVLANKIEQILETVHEIKNKLTRNEDKLSDLQREVDAIKYENKSQEDRMNKQEKKQEDQRKWLWGIMGTVTTAIIIYLINYFTHLGI
jgi:chromosome segregation ATPase